MGRFYKNIFHCKDTNKVHLWEYDTETQKTKHTKNDFENYYWLESIDPDVHRCKNVQGKWVTKRFLEKNESMSKKKKQFSEMGISTYEMGYDVESKFLLDRYGQQPIGNDLASAGFRNVFKVGFYDIEVAVGDSGFERDHLISVSKVADGLESFHMTLGDFEKTYETSEWFVFDEVKQQLVSFSQSCYAGVNKFPKPELAEYPINLITLIINKERYTIGNQLYTGDSDLVQHYHYCADELKLLESFFKLIGDHKLDILSGWNSRDFDDMYVFNRYLKLKGDSIIIKNNAWSMDIEVPHLPMGKASYQKRNKTWSVPGLSLVDYMIIFKQFNFDPYSSFALNNIALNILGKGKLEFGGEIYTIWKTDFNKFTEYNIVDTQLIDEIDEAIGFMELFVTFSYNGLIPFRRCDSSIAQIEGYIIKILHDRKMVLPDIERGDAQEFQGAYVQAVKGKKKHAVSIDASRLYPSIIEQWNISPETLVKYNGNDPEILANLIKSVIPNQYYRKDIKGFIPEIVNGVSASRDHWRGLWNKAKISGEDKSLTRYYYNLQLCFKILNNSIYGVIGHPSFAFFNIDNVSVIPLTGQHIIKYIAFDAVGKMFDNMSFKQWDKMFGKFNIDEKSFETAVSQYRKDFLLLLDTDSVYFCLDFFYQKISNKITWKEFKEGKQGVTFQEFASEMISVLIDPYLKLMCKKFSTQFNVNEFHIHFKREKIIEDIIVFAMKKYVCLVRDSEGKVYQDEPSFEVTGLEIKRTDSSKQVQKFATEMIMEVFAGADYDTLNKRVIAEKNRFKTMAIDEVAINKGIKDIEKYHTGDPFTGLISGTPIQNKLAMQFNALKTQLNIPIADIQSGTKLKYVFVRPRKNKWKIDSVAWIGKYPDQYIKEFEIDYDITFQKSCLGVITRLFDAVGWQEPNLTENSIMDFFE